MNDAADAVDDLAETDEDTPVTFGVVGNDTDVDGTVSVASIQSFTQPPEGEGSVVQNEDGTFTYTPATNFSGQTSFTYTIDDGAGGTDTATVNITVNAVNDAPEIASPSTFVIQQGDSATIENISISDIDDNGENVKPKSVRNI